MGSLGLGVQHACERLPVKPHLTLPAFGIDCDKGVHCVIAGARIADGCADGAQRRDRGHHLGVGIGEFDQILHIASGILRIGIFICRKSWIFYQAISGYTGTFLVNLKKLGMSRAKKDVQCHRQNIGGMVVLEMKSGRHTADIQGAVIFLVTARAVGKPSGSFDFLALGMFLRAIACGGFQRAKMAFDPDADGVDGAFVGIVIV